MQEAIAVTVVIAGLFFSIMCALLLEEFILGGLFILLRPAAKRVPQRPQESLFGASD